MTHLTILPAVVQAGGRQRRDRVAYLALLRRSSEYALRGSVVRVAALAVVVLGSLTSQRAWLAVAACAVPATGCVLLWANERHMARGTQPRRWLTRVYLRNIISTNGRHRLSLGSYFDLTGSFLMIALPSWVTTDSPLVVRLAMLAAGTIFFVSSALLIFNDHTWYNPDEHRPPRWHEAVRTLAGPVVVGLTSAIALPARWGPEGELAALVLCLTGFTVTSRIADTALILKYLAPLVREESHAGREQVLAETHGALSTNLRLLEQQARAVRDTAPALYELAVSANSRLRETLTLSSPDVRSSTDVANLGAPVFTLARAVGARAQVEVAVPALSPADQDLVRLVLSDLVGNALNAGATDVAVRVGTAEQGHEAGVARLVLSVTDDGPPMPPGSWRAPGTSSERLGLRLAGLGGSLTVTPPTAGAPGAVGKTVTASWEARP